MLVELGLELQTEPLDISNTVDMLQTLINLINFLLAVVGMIINIVMINNRMANCYFSSLLYKCVPFFYLKTVFFITCIAYF